MPQSIHGHEVMRRMIDSKLSYTRETLRAAIVEGFGEDAHFHTCSAKDMSADELIAFLSA